MTLRSAIMLVALIISGSGTPASYAQATNQCQLKVEGLTCEHLREPLGIDIAQPRLSWKLVAADKPLRGLSQSAYRILVASHPELLAQQRGDLWDSGKVASSQSILVRYAGRPLSSHTRCWWSVQVWDGQQQASAWSQPALWTMGILSPEDWQAAQWIGLDEQSDEGISTADIRSANWLWYPEGNAAHDAPVATRYFRRTLDIPADRKITRAIAFFAGDDMCVFYVNGAQVGVGHGHPGLVGVDIAPHLVAGANQLAAAATNARADVPNNPGGWISAVRIEFDRGDPLVIYSDKNWLCRQDRIEAWETAEIDPSIWVAAQELGQAGIGPWGIPWKERWHSEHRRLPARYLRKQFELKGDVAHASAYVCGLGFFDLHLNGARVGDQLMAPALTGYDQRAMVVTFDVTDKLKRGQNAVGVVLSNARFFAPRSQVPMPMVSYGYPKLLMHLRVQYTDGSVETIVSDSSWQLTTEGPIRASSEFDGEEYDARLEMPGWDTAAFRADKWQPARLVAAPGGHLESQLLEPIRVIQQLKPIKLVEPKPGIWMADFGQAFYGVVQLRVQGSAGTRVSMRTSFNIKSDGLLNAINDRSALNTDVYTLAGRDQVEVWHPRFRGNATRWVQVEGFPGQPTLDSFTGLVTHTDHAEVGQFACSNELVNRIYHNGVWGTRMQNRSVPMEPDRDERMPWSGHPAKTSESEGWVFNVARFYAHFLHNYRVHQAADGSLQEILPPYWQFNSKDILWPSVATIIPHWYYHFYGDDQPLRDNYEMMKRFVDYHRQTNLKADGTLDHCTYGDWVDTASIGGNDRNFGATSRPLMGTAYFYHNCRIVEQTAKLLGKDGDAQQYGQLAERVKQAFNQRFFDAKLARYQSGTQCSYVLPLAFGLVPEEQLAKVIANLIDDIENKHHGHTSVGLIGMQWLMQTLTEIGHADTAYKIATRTERPSWGYMISRGATTIWERWDTDSQDGGMNGESQKILSGNFEAWCYQALAGINYDPQQPGFKHIILRPQVVGDLQWARATHESPYGPIKSDWRIDGGKFTWNISIPPNTTATVYVPGSQPRELGSGDYEFNVSR